MNYYFASGYIQDGKLDQDCGRIVIYGDDILASKGPGMDHNDLLRSLASKFRLPKEEVIGKAIRLYYKREDGDIIVSETRKIDYEMFHKDYQKHAGMIKREIRR